MNFHYKFYGALAFMLIALSLSAQGIQIERSESSILITDYFQKNYAYILKTSKNLKNWDSVGSYIYGNDEVVRTKINIMEGREFFKFERSLHYASTELDPRLVPDLEDVLIPLLTNSEWLRLSLNANGSFLAPGILNGHAFTLSGWWQWRNSDNDPNRMIFQLICIEASVDGVSRSIHEAADTLGRTLPLTLHTSIEYLSHSEVAMIHQVQSTDGITRLERPEKQILNREPIYLILAMGQSNMVATSAPNNIQPYPELDSTILLNMSAGTNLNASDATILETESETNGEWTTSDERLSAYGLERSFARSLANQGKNVAVAKWARNGQNIARWNNQLESSNYYNIWTAWYHQRITQLRAMGYDVHPIFLWSQGSADCKFNRGSEYQKELNALIDTIRLLSRKDATPIVIGRTYRGINHPDIPTDVSSADYIAVRTAQTIVGERTNCIWYDRDSMSFRDGHTHFYSSEYQREGADLAFTSYWSRFSEY